MVLLLIEADSDNGPLQFQSQCAQTVIIISVLIRTFIIGVIFCCVHTELLLTVRFTFWDICVTISLCNQQATNNKNKVVVTS